MARRDGGVRVIHTLTRERPAGWAGHLGRIDRALLAETCFPPRRIQRSSSADPRPSSRTSHNSWWSSGMSRSSSRPSGSAPREDEHYG